MFSVIQIIIVITIWTDVIHGVKIVSQTSSNTTMTCPVPTDWTHCTFSHKTGALGKCELLNQPDGQVQVCGAFSEGGGSEGVVRYTGGVCRLELYNVRDGHNGTWACEISTQEESCNSYNKEFSLAIIHTPSAVEVNPPVGNSLKYSLDSYSEATLTIHNVQPRPSIHWTMDGEDIDGVYFISASVIYNEDMQVMDTLAFFGKQEFDKKKLEYNITLEVIDEWGNVEVAYTNFDFITMSCNNCPDTTSPPSSTTTSTTTFTTPITTTTSTSTTSTPVTAVTNTKTPLITTITSSAPSIITTGITMSTEATTDFPLSDMTTSLSTASITTVTTDSPSTTSTPTVEAECHYNMTDPAGTEFHYPPQPGTRCRISPPPTWTIIPTCPQGNSCLNSIAISIASLSYTSNPCDTKMKISTVAPGNVHLTRDNIQIVCFNETTPLQLNFGVTVVKIELLNIIDDNQVSFTANYWYSV